MTAPDSNPYASPAAIEVERVRRLRTELMWRLRGPSIGLLVLASLQSLYLILALVNLTQILVKLHTIPPPLVVPIFLSIPSAIILVAAWRMRQMRSITFCRLGALLACIPVLTPIIFLGIPFGIWATIVLFMPSTAVAFDQAPLVEADLGED